MNRTRRGVRGDEVADGERELVSGSIRRDVREVASGLRFHDGEDVGGPAAHVLGIPFGQMSRSGRTGRAHVRVV